MWYGLLRFIMKTTLQLFFKEKYFTLSYLTVCLREKSLVVFVWQSSELSWHTSRNELAEDSETPLIGILNVWMGKGRAIDSLFRWNSPQRIPSIV